jgi:radical SAM protein with 4Fe4S-binding SPASM domain
VSLIQELDSRALALGIPLSTHLDITYRCNERCEHCYLDHDDKGEMTTAEIRGVLQQLAQAGVFFLTLSGGEPFLRRDCFEIIEFARSLLFCVKVKTNALLIRQKEAQRLRDLNVDQIQISVYSHRPEVHDAVTKVRGSLKRTLEGIHLLKSVGLKVTIANVLMRGNLFDGAGVQKLAADLGVSYTYDPTITPMMNGDTSVLRLRIESDDLRQVFRNSGLVGNTQEFCAPPPPVSETDLNSAPCSAGHTFCYISPYGDVFPCVQFPLPTGNVRRQKFLDIWQHSPALREVRSIRASDLPVCSTCAHVGTCTRCPGLAYMEGNMRGPSTADCEKSFVRTGIPSANMKLRATSGSPKLVQIQGLVAAQHVAAAPQSAQV